MRNFTVKDGLPSNNVYHVMQDHKGLIWFSTDRGVAQFDGYTFTNLTAQQGLADDEVFSTHEDNEHRMWFLTQNGQLTCLEENGEFTRIAEPNPSIPEEMLRSWAQLPNGTIVVTQVGSAIEVKNAQQKVLYRHPRLDLIWTLGNQVQMGIGRAVIQYPSGDTLGTISFDEGSPTRVNRLNDRQMGLMEHLKCVIIDSTGPQQTLHLPAKYGEIIACFLPEPNTIWLGTRNGVIEMNLTTGEHTNHFLKGLAVSSVFRDSEGNSWFTTLEEGVFMWPSSQVRRWNFPSAAKGLSIRSLLPEDDTLWVGFNNSSYAQVLPNEVKLYSVPSRRPEPIRRFRRLGSSLFVITKIRSQNHYHQDQQFTMYLNDLTWHHNKWVVMSRPVCLWTPEEMVKARGSQTTLDSLLRSNMLLPTTGTELLKDPTDQLWMGTFAGLYLMVPGQMHPIHVLPNLLNSSVSHLADLNHQPLVAVATSRNGIFILKDTQVVERYDQSSGLPAGRCQAFWLDNYNNIWLGSANQLFKINRESGTGEVENYSVKLGLDLEVIRSLAIKNHQLLIGTDDGLFYYNLQNDEKEPRQLNLEISEMRVNQHLREITDDLSLLSRENHIRFNFKTLSYHFQNQVTYQYRLLGLDSSWSLTTSRNADYKALPPGTYEFQLQATVQNMAQSPLMRVSFEVETPFYRRWWFIVGTTLLLGLLIYGIYTQRLATVRKRYALEREKLMAEKQKEATEKKLAMLQEQALRSQMNPHFIFNALNTIKGYYAEGRKDLAQNYIVKFSRLLRIILESSHTHITLANETELLKLYLELLQLRYDDTFTYHISQTHVVDAGSVLLPSMILQPFVENAVIHGLMPQKEPGHLEIQFSISNSVLHVVIEDNGVGRSYHQQKPHSSSHNSVATQLTQQRLDLLDLLNHTRASVEIVDLFKNQKPAGTRVLINIPIAYEY